MPKSLYCTYAFPFLAMQVVMMDLFESWRLIIKKFMLHILFMFITLVTLNKSLPYVFIIPLDYTTICHHNPLNVYLRLFIGSISFLFIFLIRCLKFLMSIPIAQIIVFLHFVMCHTCINIFLPYVYTFIQAWCVYINHEISIIMLTLWTRETFVIYIYLYFDS
jgi:hypothetical protein